MLFKKSVFILFILVSFSKINAQNFELGKVSVAELQEKEHPKDPSAAAAILFKKGEVTFEYSQSLGFQMYTKVKTRIKIYKKEGYEWANQKVRYYLGNKFKESVSFSDAVTYNLVQGKIEKTKFKNEGEFDENIDKYWGQKKITMPNVKEGSVIEFEYVIKSPSIGSLKEWDFQTSIPVNYSEYKTSIPEYYTYNPRQKGYVFPKVTLNNIHRSIDFTNNVRTGTMETKIEVVESKLEYNETQTTYLAENLPAIKEEAYVNNIDNYTSSISNELAIIKRPNKTTESYATDWKTVTKKIYDNEDFGLELNKIGYFEKEIDALLIGLKTRDEMIFAIFNFVKLNVKWNGYYGYSCNDGVKKAYQDKTGNVAEINLMLTAMLRYAGLTANPVLVSTRSNGIAVFPNRTAFNYVIAAVENENNIILLDATDKFSTPNILPFRDLNWVGRLIRKDETSEEIDLMPKVASNYSVSMAYSIDANGLVTGKIRKTRTDHSAMVFRMNNGNVKEDSYLEKLENENKKIEISDYIRTNENDLNLPVGETFSFSGSNLCEIMGGKIYINPMLFLAMEQNPFKQENREYPVDYGFPFLDKYVINIQIPEGYVAETIPAPVINTMEDNLGGFKYMITNSGNTIQLSISQQINTAIMPSEYYSMIKEYYQSMIAKQNEKIILTKIQ